MKATVDGFRLILIGDMHEQPILHLNLRPFVTTVKDWSSEVGPFVPLCIAVHVGFVVQRFYYPRDSNQLLESDEFTLGTM